MHNCYSHCIQIIQSYTSFYNINNGSQSYTYIAPTCASFYALPSFNAYLDQDGSWLQIPEQQLWVGRRHDNFSPQWIGLWSWIVQASSLGWSNPWSWTWSRNRLAWSVQIVMSCRCELFLRYLWKKIFYNFYNSLLDSKIIIFFLTLNMCLSLRIEFAKPA